MTDDVPNGGAAVPVVSAIIANYNAAPFIEACLRSVLDGELAKIEVVVVDDRSTDDGVAIARQVAARDPRVRVVETPRNGGPAAARNLGLSLARGRYVAIVDSDDLIHRSRFARLVAAADASGADMIADDLLVFQNGSAAPPERFLKAADRSAPFGLDLAEYLRRSVLYGDEPAPGFLKPVIRRDRLLASGVRYDETLRIAEDDDLVARLLLAGLSYRIEPTPWYFYRKHGGSISHRLTLGAVEAMRVADAGLMRDVIAKRPDLAARCAARTRALDRVWAFETLIAALKRRAPWQAAASIARHPAVLPMLRMPLAGLMRKLTPRRAAPTIPPDREQAYLIAVAERAGA